MRSLILLLALVVIGGSMSAQPIYTTANLPSAGLTITWDQADTIGVQPGPGGANQTWTFSDVTLNGESYDLKYVDPANSPYAADFPSATLAEESDTAWSYYELSGGTWTRLGEVLADIQSGQWSNPLDYARLPWAYGESFQDDAEHQFEVEGIVTDRTVTMDATYDGYGTLTLPQGTFKNVFRIAYRQISVDTAEIQAGPITIGTSITTDLIAWVWFQEGNPQPLLAIDTARITMRTGPPANQVQRMRFPHVQVTRQVPSGGGEDPQAPTIVSPANNARIPGGTATLVWTKPSGSVTTRVQVARDEAFSALVTNEVVATESYMAEGLEIGTTYYWRLATVTPAGIKRTQGRVQAESDWTPVRQFVMVPEAPVLTSPENDAAVPNETVTLTWSPTTAKSHIQVSASNTFDPLAKELETADATAEFTLNGQDGAPYYWRVRNLAANGVEGEWSTVRSFRIAVVSVEEELMSDMRLYPNPVTTSAQLSVAGAPVSSYTVMDAAGRTRSFTSIQEGKPLIHIPVDQLEPGVYSLVVHGTHAVRAFRLVVLR